MVTADGDCRGTSVRPRSSNQSTVSAFGAGRSRYTPAHVHHPLVRKARNNPLRCLSNRVRPRIERHRQQSPHPSRCRRPAGCLTAVSVAYGWGSQPWLWPRRPPTASASQNCASLSVSSSCQLHRSSAAGAVWRHADFQVGQCPHNQEVQEQVDRAGCQKDLDGAVAFGDQVSRNARDLQQRDDRGESDVPLTINMISLP